MEHENTRPEVEVVDIDMPFISMVVFMVKWAIASIPALIILYVIGTLGIRFLLHDVLGPSHRF